MRRQTWAVAVLAGAIALGVAPSAAFGQDADEGPRHPDIGSFQDLVNGLNGGHVSIRRARQLGLSVFSTPFNTYDGMGDGPFDLDEWLESPLAFGHRPTLQGNGLSLRVNGLDAQSCNECHTIVSNRETPPTLGFAGVGGIVQNAIIVPSMIDVADSGDDRTSFAAGHNPDLPLAADGNADYNGRYANPPFLFGGGGIELLGKEMTADLQQHLAVARSSPAGTVVSLDTHGVNFGSITSLGGGAVDLSAVEGVGFENQAGHTPEEILVVRPFGRKGDAFSMRDFDRAAMQFHFGIQPVEVVDPAGAGGVDEDGDGVTEEVTEAEMSVLHIFDVTNPKPVVDKLGRQGRRGFETFEAIGCTDCHVPVLRTRTRFVPLAHPEVPHDPNANVYARIDLTKEAGFDRAGSGVLVPCFADLKRHKMGPRLAETFEAGVGAVAQDEFTTARLWGVSDTAPYLHDGRATTLYQAIEFHGGEAEAQRDRFINDLTVDEQRDVLAFLRKLRTPEGANEDLLHGGGRH